MSVKLEKGEVAGGINMTPMIDCVFLLLIFFLVATEFRDEEFEMNVVLPQASEARPLIAKPRELFVNVTQDGRYMIAAQELNANQLYGALLQAYSDNPLRQTVIIRADKRCPWEHVMTVMNLCNKAKIKDYRVTAMDGTGS